MKISYAITVKDELEEIKRLINLLLPYKNYQDEIVILYDHDNGDEKVAEFLTTRNILPNVQFWRGFGFEGHFANWKNKLNRYCTGDYIFQIDADEEPHTELLDLIPAILGQGIDLIYVPRANTVEGLTQQHIERWRWNVNGEGFINFPDYQPRIYKNSNNIKWEGKVHERVVGQMTQAVIPAEYKYCILHNKTITKQEKQNNYYDTL